MFAAFSAPQYSAGGFRILSLVRGYLCTAEQMLVAACRWAFELEGLGLCIISPEDRC